MYDQLLYSALIPSMSSPEKRTSKKKKKEPSPNPSLPDDFLLSCFARISTLYYPSLSLVSKSFRSLLTSPELYKVRSLSDHTECCLYVCIQFFSDLGPTWYTLCRKPDQTKSSSSSSEYVLAKVPILNSPRASFTGLVSVGPNIYNINSGPVSILNCRSHTWSEGPSMRDDLYSLSASVVDEKIYVIGRSRDCKNSLHKSPLKKKKRSRSRYTCSTQKLKLGIL
ncbi:F-box/kelch-repeat protein At4g39550 [Brassica rapa]|uniref:F-box/kelch-repeat protein At4g39550 n=1 Tax=Brassica campestris TaxID=3711 RepID=UPI00142DCEE0|nr:F-box/kelch-repeat protein At4g39550 [Brassica rapa]